MKLRWKERVDVGRTTGMKRKVAGMTVGVAAVLSVAGSALLPAGAAERAWDYSTLTHWKSIPAYAPVYGLAFSPDEKTLAGVTEERIFLWNDKGEAVHTLTLEQAADTDLLRKPETVMWHRCIAFSRDGKTLATAATDNVVRLYN